MSGSRVLRKEEEKRNAERDMLMKCLLEMLRDEDNRYCADCDAKGPRWASWNIGVFLCIRCAGIHRKLGSHVSKVKSVNLDSWTPEQVQSMRVMGNSTARGIYEAGLPEHFRRPASDQSMEQFIRAKYETKRYAMKDWVQPPVDPKDLPIWDDLEQLWKHGVLKSKTTGSIAAAAAASKPSTTSAAKLPAPQTIARDRPRSPSNVSATGVVPPKPDVGRQPSNDLLGLDLGAGQQHQTAATGGRSSAVDDLLGLGIGGSHASAAGGGFAKVDSAPDFSAFGTGHNNVNNNNNDRFDAFHSATADGTAGSKSDGGDDLFGAFVDAGSADGGSKPTGKGTTAADIMALYAQTPQPPAASQARTAHPQHQHMGQQPPAGYPGGMMGGPMSFGRGVTAPAAGPRAPAVPAAQLPPQLVGFQSARPSGAPAFAQQQHAGFHVHQQPQQAHAAAAYTMPQPQQQAAPVRQPQPHQLPDAFAGLNIAAARQTGWVPPAGQNARPPAAQQHSQLSLW